MKRFTDNQHGFGFVAVLGVIVVLGIVAIAGMRVMNTDSNIAGTSSVSRNHAVPTKIANTADLTKASAALDATPVDSGVNPDQLDTDLNALL